MSQGHMLHYVQSSFICDMQKLEKITQMSEKVWIQKMWFIYIIEYYSAIKNKDIMSFVANGWN